jgi:hypothetical protein
MVQRCGEHKNLWERACSRWRLYIQHLCCLPVRYREQTRSHMDCGVQAIRTIA